MSFSDLKQQFDTFHESNPDVYTELVSLARRWKENGNSKLGIATVFEVLRWNRHLAGVKDNKGFKLNNNYRSFYARMIMANEPDLDGVFDVRAQSDIYQPMVWSQN